MPYSRLKKSAFVAAMLLSTIKPAAASHDFIPSENETPVQKETMACVKKVAEGMGAEIVEIGVMDFSDIRPLFSSNEPNQSVYIRMKDRSMFADAFVKPKVGVEVASGETYSQDHGFEVPYSRVNAWRGCEGKVVVHSFEQDRGKPQAPSAMLTERQAVARSVAMKLLKCAK